MGGRIKSVREAERQGCTDLEVEVLYTPGNGKCSCKIVALTMASHIELDATRSTAHRRAQLEGL